MARDMGWCPVPLSQPANAREIAEPRIPEHWFGGTVGKLSLSGPDGGPVMHQ